ncbi:uncharacterized protein LOC122205061 isoform X2 [Panthera leo]|uniref:uncharacterized protein LOC122205061 isoform X2 n=1 Tax=Panthera leo TaxID=9689 RepID=UPI001C69F3EA|nr:uncharacterized protein LOC122205061 isoform X2 [Panthera leo]
MFSCCVPVSRGCRLRGARGRDASRPWRQWVRSCTGCLRSLARRDPKKSTDEIGKRLAESRFTCPTELCVCPVAQKGHPGPRERVAARRSWEAGPGDGLGRPSSAPRLRRKVLVTGPGTSTWSPRSQIPRVKGENVYFKRPQSTRMNLSHMKSRCGPKVSLVRFHLKETSRVGPRSPAGSPAPAGVAPDSTPACRDAEDPDALGSGSGATPASAPAPDS